MARWMVIVVALLMITSCKIRIEVPKGGVVKTVSGAYTCNTGKVCNVDVIDLFFDETFIAQPADGYIFQSWEKRHRGLCGGNSDPCHLFTSGFEGHEALMAFLDSDEVFHLNPVFEKLDDCIGPVLEPRLVERWEKATARLYAPQEDRPLLRADAGTWLLGDTVSESDDCGSSPHRARISRVNGSKALTLVSKDSNSSCADNIFLTLQEIPQLNLNTGFTVPVTKKTIISFKVSGNLVNPGAGRNTCIIPPCGDTVSLALQVLPSGSELVYVLQRAPNAVPNTRRNFYREIFLNPNAGNYRRNLMNDLMTIPNFSPAGAEVRLIGFEVDEHGSATLDNLVIGEGSAEACPVPPEDPSPPKVPPRGVCEPIPAGEAAVQIKNDLNKAVEAYFKAFALGVYMQAGECATVLVPSGPFNVEITRCDIDTEDDCKGPARTVPFNLSGDKVKFIATSDLF